MPQYLYVDTHSHVNLNDYRDDADEVIRRALNNNVAMLIAGTDYKSSRRALDLANKYQAGVYCAVGLHPDGLADRPSGEHEIFNYEMYEKLARFNKTVAIGEIGLDYYHLDIDQDVALIKRNQQHLLKEQLTLALNLDLPVIIHCRQAHDDMLKLLGEWRKENKNWRKNKPWGVMHCFSGNDDLAWQYFNLGLIVSFTGLITFSKQWDDLIRKLPDDKFMIETDCPYMTPEPYRGARNEPVLVQLVAKRIAEIKNLTMERVAELTSANAKELFGI